MMVNICLLGDDKAHHRVSLFISSSNSRLSANFGTEPEFVSTFVHIAKSLDESLFMGRGIVRLMRVLIVPERS